MPPEIAYTLRRADGTEIGGDYAFLTAVSGTDWDGAEADADDLDEQREYWLETWVLVKRESRMLGPEPIEDDDEPEEELLGDRPEISDAPDIKFYGDGGAALQRETDALFGNEP